MATAFAEPRIGQARTRNRTIRQARRASTNRRAIREPLSRQGESETKPARTESIKPQASVADSVVIERLRQDCLAAIAGGRASVDIDLQEVRQANTRLVACLLLVVRAARDAGAKLKVHTSRQVRAWLRICAVETLVESAQLESSEQCATAPKRRVRTSE